MMLFGLAGNDSLIGGAFDDLLDDGDGNDALAVQDGGEDRDTALGGQGGPTRGGRVHADKGDELFACEIIDEAFFDFTLVELMIVVAAF